MQQTLRNLIADGKTKQAIAELRRLTASDSDANNAVNLLASRFAEYEKQKLGNLEDPSVLGIELNKINNALLEQINSLEANGTSATNRGASDGVPLSHTVTLNPAVTKPAATKQGFSWTKWTGLNDVKSWVALFAGLAGMFTFYFNFCGQKITDKNKLTNVSVVVEDQNHDLIPAFHKGEDAFVLMTVEGGDTKEEVIDYKGTASFKNVKVGDIVRLKVKFSEPYRPSHPDSVYTIPSDGRLTLTVALQNLGRVFGTVIYRNAPLEGVLVDAEGFRDTTDLTGRFDISIPENARRKEPEVKFLKKGFKMSLQKAHPQTDTPLNIVMEK